MRPPRRPVVAGLLAALTLAACSTEETSSPAPTFSTTTTTTTLPATTTTSTTLPATTTTTTTTSPPRPTLPPPGAPVDRRVDLYVGGAEAQVGWLALGAWDGTDWTDDAELPSAGDPVRVTSLASGVSETEFAGTADACFDETGPTIGLDLPDVDPPGFGYGYIAVGGDWALHPRPTVEIDQDVPRYRALAEALIDDEPVDPSDGSITDFLLADLDADGTEEAIFVFEYVQDSSTGRGEPGDFSMLVLVDTSSSTPYPLFTSVVPPLPPPTTDPQTGSTLPQQPELLDRARVLDIADLNGDGRMELITRTWYFEGSAVQVTTYRDRTADLVLEAGCGN